MSDIVLWRITNKLNIPQLTPKIENMFSMKKTICFNFGAVTLTFSLL